ncbi:MAG: MBL fold metallo-hydrolase [Candidatus Aminicenantes bacterium]|nr:MBL fold metallo-hydrolase [Candidatus Aminicenantes bacterium]
MNELCFLGTGGAIPHKNRSNAALVLNSQEDLVLIDCPGDAFVKLKQMNLDPRCISSVFITHIHPDHVYGLPSLIHSLMLNDMTLSVFGSEETVVFCKKLLSLFNLLDEKVKCRVRFNRIGPNEHFQLLPLSWATSIKTPHHSSSLGVFLELNDELGLLYSGDIPVYPPLFKGIGNPDILIHDCSAPSRFFRKFPSLSQMHTHSLDLGKLAQQAGVKCLIPIHFFGELDYSMEEIKTEIKENYQNRLIIPKDLDRLRLSASLLTTKDKT